MEADEPFAEYKPELFPRLRRAGEFLSRVLTVQQLASHGDHIPSWLESENTGAEVMLEEELYDIPEQLETD